MTPEEFRRAGRAVVDWIADYLERVDGLPVRARVRPGEILSRLPETPPEHGEPFAALMADLERIVLPGLTHWQSPRFFAFFPANISGPSILGELLAAGLGVQGMVWETGPACTELEIRVLDWLAGMLGLPETFSSRSAGGGVIQDTASSATLTAMATARERATGWRSNRVGVREPLVAYASTQAHSSVEKAAMVCGIGRENVRAVAVDRVYAMRPEALEAAVRADLERGLRPFFVCATLGTTSSHAFDPVPAIAEVARAHDLWLHVDAAEAGAALLCPEHRHLGAGLEEADSFCFNPHKHLLTNFDCDAYYVRDREALVRTMRVLPEYLATEATRAGGVTDFRDWHVPLGRRFRALKLWFVIRYYGVAGLRAYYRRHVELAARVERFVDRHRDLELAAPRPLTLVCFRHRAGDAATQRLLAALNDSGEAYFSHTRLDGRHVVRWALGAPGVDESHLERTFAHLARLAQNLARDGAG